MKRHKKQPVRVSTGLPARLQILKGVEEMAAVVGATYGPHGRTVMLDRAGGLLSTKDGVSVAWEVSPDNPLQRLGTRLLQEACSKVNKRCGDGTTTTALLTAALLRIGTRYVASGVHPASLARELQEQAHLLDEANLWDLLCPIPVEDEGLMQDVAATACNGDTEIASAIVAAFSQVGEEGIIVVEEGKGRGVEIDHKTGMEIDKGWESSDLAHEDGGPRKLDVPLVALIDAELTTIKDIAPILEEATQFPHPLVIVSRGCFGEAVKMMVANDRKLDRADGQKFEVMAVRCPGHVDHMRHHLDDLAALTGATVVDPLHTPLKNFKSEFLGSAQTVTVSRDSTVFVAFEDKYPLIERRVGELQNLHTEFSYDSEEVRTRIAKLTDGFCVMRVGGDSDTEIRERRGRIEDALHTVRTAMERGVVPGGGVSYLALSCFLQNTANSPLTGGAGVGAQVLSEALREPLKTISRNSGYEPPVVLQKVLDKATEPGATTPCPDWETGWDPATNEVRDFRTFPVICDPLAVVRQVILTAVSTAATLLTVEAALTQTS